MKSSPLALKIASCLALLALGLTPAHSAETPKAEKTVIGSIRPATNLKPAERAALAKISFNQALQIALGAVKGQIVKGELEIEDGNLLFSFEIVTDSKVMMEVEIDAGDGKVLDIDRD